MNLEEAIKLISRKNVAIYMVKNYSISTYNQSVSQENHLTPKEFRELKEILLKYEK